MLKKIVAVILIAVTAFTFASCKDKAAGGKQEQSKLTVEAVANAVYGDVFDLKVSGGAGTGAVVYSLVSGNAGTVSAAGKVVCTGVGELVVKATKGADSQFLSKVSENCTISVGKKPITVTADPASKGVGTNDPEFTYTVDKDISQLTALSGALSRKAGEEAGEYDILQGTLTNENNENYDITFVGGKFKIGVYAQIISAPDFIEADLSGGVDLTGYLDEVQFENQGGNEGVTVGIESVSANDVIISDINFKNFAPENIFEQYEVRFYVQNAFGKIFDTFSMISNKNTGHFETQENYDAWRVESSQTDDNARKNDDTFWSSEEKWQYANGEAFTLLQKKGDYYLGSGEESIILTAQSPSFVVRENSFISFKLGGAKNGESVFVALCDSDGSQLEKYVNYNFADPDSACNMNRFIYPIGKHAGREVSIKIVDEAESDFGFVNFDDLWVNLSADEAKLQLHTERTWAENLAMLDTPKAISFYDLYTNAIKKHYAGLEILPVDAVDTKLINADESSAIDLTAYLSEVEVYQETDYSVSKRIISVKRPDGSVDESGDFTSYDLSVAGSYDINYKIGTSAYEFEKSMSVLSYGDALNQIVNGDFELGNLTGWEVVSGNLKNDNPIDDMYGMWGEDMPFNKSGAYFFNGEMAQDEGVHYALKSTVFTLAGSGYISFKMAGNDAKIKVYTEDQTLIAKYNNVEFLDENYPDIAKGCRLNTMTTFVADLSSYVGKKLYIEICDEEPVSGGWKRAWFDEIITYYETAPDVNVLKDVVLNSKHADIPDRSFVELAWREAVNDI